MSASDRLDKVQSELFDAMGDVRGWCDNEYQSNFAQYFEGVPELYEQVSSTERKLTDSELEWILTSVPLQLITVSEVLSSYKLNLECLKLHTKKKESEYVCSSSEKTVTAKKEDASLKVSDYKLLASAYSSVVSRVENQINFARELVMSAKKIWDSRTKTYEANPINPMDDLEIYSMSSGKERYAG